MAGLTACTDAVVFQEDAEVPSGRWVRNWQPEFTFNIGDTLSPHDLYLDLRHTGDYPYSNFYSFITLTTPGGERHTDTVECTLADPTGRWFGKGTGFIFSDRFRAHVLYKLRDRFPQAGEYRLRIEQAMRTDTLDGIIDVGISVERSPSRGS